MSGAPLGIYVHVPFCRTRCRYCDFYRVGENRSRMDRFVSALGREIDGWSELHGRTVDSLFFGGGTPSLLEPAEIGTLVERLADRFAFRPDVEITAEANPSDLTSERLAGLRQAGISRLSLGVQSLVDRELRLLGRRHDARAAIEVVGSARRAGFADLSIDLMVGIPAQTDGSFRTTLERVLALEPDHVSLYLLEVHAGSEMDALRRTRPGSFAGEEALRRRYLAMRERLLAAGFRHYEISNFARPGHECRHNLRYWRAGEWLGLGPAAHSSLGGRRFQHEPDLDRWIERPHAVLELEAHPAEERVMLGLRLEEGIEERWLLDAAVSAEEIEKRLVRLAPFLERAEGRIRLRPEGFLVSNAVLASLLA